MNTYYVTHRKDNILIGRYYSSYQDVTSDIRDRINVFSSKAKINPPLSFKDIRVFIEGWSGDNPPRFQIFPCEKPELPGFLARIPFRRNKKKEDPLPPPPEEDPLPPPSAPFPNSNEDNSDADSSSSRSSQYMTPLSDLDQNNQRLTCEDEDQYLHPGRPSLDDGSVPPPPYDDDEFEEIGLTFSNF